MVGIRSISPLSCLVCQYSLQQNSWHSWAGEISFCLGTNPICVPEKSSFLTGAKWEHWCIRSICPGGRFVNTWRWDQLIGGTTCQQPGAATKYSTTRLSPSYPTTAAPAPANANVLPERNPFVLTPHKSQELHQRAGDGWSVERFGAAARRLDLCVWLSTREGAGSLRQLSGESNRCLPLFTSELRPINSVRWKIVKSALFSYLMLESGGITLICHKNSHQTILQQERIARLH